ncbi:MAG: sigma-54 interaction domain-containing protein [Vicinamibacterales bacterium]
MATVSSIELPRLVWQSPLMASVCALASRVAPGDAKVVITGESGVGKDVVARLIHVQSKRAAHPFVAVNCAAFTETLLESELFGHVKGAFTGAYRDKAGKLQLADKGTIFLDEVGEMCMRMQALLLRFLENGEMQPVGAHGPVPPVDVRVIAATNRNLADLVAAGRFREDLLYRLKVVHIRIPPLRERAEDIAPLVEHFARETGRPIRFTDAAMKALERYRWPGNIRELQNVVEQLAWTAGVEAIDVPQLPPAIIGESETRLTPVRERRRQVADELFDGLVSGRLLFWEHVHRLFLDRDITRNDIRGLIARGLSAASGSYRTLLQIFGLDEQDYKRFMNFLSTHECTVDYRAFRRPGAEPEPYVDTVRPLVPRLQEAEAAKHRSGRDIPA